MSKVRRIDFYPDDWIAGTGDLSVEERGVYITCCSLFYSRGGPITLDHLRRQCPGHARPFNRALERLLALGKLTETADGMLTQRRCETELKLAQNRIETSQENGRNGGRPIRKNNDLDKPAGFSRAREDVVTTTTTTKKKRRIGGRLGRDAPFLRTDEDHAEVDQTVGAAVNGLKLVAGAVAVHDPDAYQAAIDSRIWNGWLNRLARYVGLNLSGGARTEAEELIEAARAAGSRKANPPHVRKTLDKLSKLDNAWRKWNSA